MKPLGDQLKSADSTWQESQAVILMGKRLEVKFSKPLFKSFLKDTEQRILIEANKFDRYWSSGISVKDPTINNSNSWPGKNTLGELIIDLRSSR